MMMCNFDKEKKKKKMQNAIQVYMNKTPDVTTVKLKT
jgi:hypothetical protein